MGSDIENMFGYLNSIFLNTFHYFLKNRNENFLLLFFKIRFLLLPHPFHSVSPYLPQGSILRARVPC